MNIDLKQALIALGVVLVIILASGNASIISDIVIPALLGVVWYFLVIKNTPSLS